MKSIIRICPAPEGLSPAETQQALQESLAPLLPKTKKILLLPPDYTRLYSGVGALCAQAYRMLSPHFHVDVMPALGTHLPMISAEITEMFQGAIPPEQVIPHNWREDVTNIGEIPVDFLQSLSPGENQPISVEINRRLLDPDYGLILSLGQVLPHEVAGFASHSKNVLVGCGGHQMINRSHMLSASAGLRKTLGQELSPVRQLFDYAQTHFLSGLPLVYAMTVSAPHQGSNRIRGLYIGQDRALFSQAAQHSAALNITPVHHPARKIVAYMDEKEYKSTWLANKAIYRSCMALAPGGELLILAPGVRQFGEDPLNDALIRRYGYRGTAETLRALSSAPDLAKNQGVAAHLIHGSSDGTFTIRYATVHLTPGEIESVGYAHAPLAEALARYCPDGPPEDGFHHTADGEEFLYLGHPGAGLWKA